MTHEPLHEAVLRGGGTPQAGICTAAFSGGADSTALLLCLYELRDVLQIDLRAVHVHHGIRGEEADRDAQFCADFCAKYGIPFVCEYVDVPAYAAAEKLSAETAARLLRYRAFDRIAPEGELATAHHAGDNVETVLFHLLRGSGMKGLRGILPRSGRIIRPILTAEKSEILDFLHRRGQTFVEDSTNFTAESSRNRIRMELLPLMLRENPSALRHIAHTAELLAEDEAYLTAEAEAAYQSCYDVQSSGFSTLLRYARPIRMRMYMLALSRLPLSCRIDPAFELLRAIDDAVCSGSGTVNLSADDYAQVYRGILYIQRRVQRPPETEIPLQIGENMPAAGRICTAILHEGDAVSQNLHTADTKATLDFDKIEGRAFFRRRKADDRITLPGRGFASLLKKCVQAEVPLPERQTLCTLYDEAGCIWCEHIGVAARVKPNRNSRRILTLSVRAAETTKKE